MDSVAPRQWRLRKSERLRETLHTREVHDVPPDIIARIEALEEFAQAMAEKSNRLELLLFEAQQEISKRALGTHSHEFDELVKIPRTA